MPGDDTLSPALRQAVEDLGDESGKWAVLDNPLALGANVRLLSQDEFSGLSGGTLNDRWEGFHLEFPESPGLMQLHAVGFSNDSATAVMPRAHFVRGPPPVTVLDEEASYEVAASGHSLSAVPAARETLE